MEDKSKEEVKRVPKPPLKEIQPGDLKPGQSVEQAQKELDKSLKEAGVK